MRERQEFPTPEQAGKDPIPRLLFTPLKVGGLELKNRIVAAPMGVSFATPENYFDYFLARARGGAGLIMMGGVLIEPSWMSVLDLLQRAHNELLSNLLKEIHAQGCKFGIQFVHLGRQTSSKVTGIPAVGPSPIPDPVFKEMPQVLTQEDIKNLVEKFAGAAQRAKEIGFDLIEIHAAHGYLVSSFLSPHANCRDDEYGGDIKGRARFPLEIIQRVREVVGDDFPLGCRFNGADNYPGGVTVQESKITAQLLQEAGANYLSISAGVHGSNPVIIPPFYEPNGCYVPLSAEVKRAVNIPVITVGRINSPWLAEEILTSGKADLIAMGRALLADPDLPNKVAGGEFDEIRPCLGCNKGCVGFFETGQPTTCLVNPEVGRESERALVPAAKPKKVLIAGGGLAGLEVARVAARRGHEVVLYEEHDKPGGQWQLVSAVPYKKTFGELIDYQMRQLRQLGVMLEMGTRVTSEIIRAEKPDVAVIATGAEPMVPAIPGVEQKQVLQAWDILAGKAQPGKDVLVVGGNAVGLETAHFLAVMGRRVTVGERVKRIGADLVPTIRFHILHKLREAGVQLLPSTNIMSIQPDGVVMSTEEGKEFCQKFDTIVLAVGSKARNELVEEIKDKVPEIHIIGDAVQPRSGLEAMHEGAEVGRKI